MRSFLGLGSNLGDRRAHLAHALRRLAEETRLTGVSSVYESAPVGFTDQPPFLNLVARIETTLAPLALLGLTRRIEAERDRERSFRNAPRTLDIDILLIGDLRLSDEELTVPHPRLPERDFVLVPLLELEPDLVHPASGRRLAERLDRRSVQGVERVGSEDWLRGEGT